MNTLKGFAQLAIMTGHLPGADATRQKTTVPVFFSFMTEKTTQAYSELFEHFKTQAPEGFVLEQISIDCEAAMKKGILEQFGNTQIKLCVWHCTRSWDRKLSDKKYKYLSFDTMTEKYGELYNMIKACLFIIYFIVKYSFYIETLKVNRSLSITERFQTCIHSEVNC